MKAGALEKNDDEPWAQTPRTGPDVLCDGFRLRPVEGEGALPEQVALSGPRPSPARSSTELVFAVPQEVAGQSIELSVFDVLGRRVRRLFDSKVRPGRYAASWDLRDAAGSRVRSGLYFARLNVGKVAISRTIQVIQ